MIAVHEVGTRSQSLCLGDRKTQQPSQKLTLHDKLVFSSLVICCSTETNLGHDSRRTNDDIP